ncbi:MAG: AAA family ATPase [Clostridia bacterium]|nr:AAA family ATPase [Clostridia bacterium]
MRIEQIHIDSFMGKKDYTLRFDRGVNIIEGENESGKSTVAAFIRFMLYGASSKGEPSARQLYLGFGEPSLGGSMELSTSGGHFRIDRVIHRTQSGFRESVAVSDLDRRCAVFKGENPGEALLFVPETVFEKTAVITQSGEGYTGGEELSAAIENLLFSADETVSTEKAQKRLDALRVSLLHKNGKGGLICDLENEIAVLEERLDKALAGNSEIIAKEGSLADTAARIESNKTDAQRYRRLCELYADYLAHLRFQKADAEEQRAVQLRTALQELDTRFDGFVPDNAYMERLKQMMENARLLELRAAEAQGRLQNKSAAADAAAQALSGDKPSEALTAAARRASRTMTAARIFSVFGILALICGLALIGVAYLFRLPSLYGYVGGGILCALGAALLIFSGLRRRGTKTVLRTFGVYNLSELSAKAKEAEENYAQAENGVRTAEAELAAARELYESESAAAAEAKRALEEEVRRRGGENGDAAALLSALDAYFAKQRDLRAALHDAETKTAHLREENAAFDRAAVEASLSVIPDLSVFETFDIADCTRKRDFAENAMEALTTKKSDLEQSLAALRATAEPPAPLSAALSAMKKKLQAAKAKAEATMLAQTALENASEGLRTRISPRLASSAGKLLRAITDGRYEELGVDNDLGMTFLAAGGAHDVAYLSHGTRECAYFALRIALADLLFAKEKAPLLLDECFAHIDDARTEKMLRLLGGLAEGGTQSLVFTCHTREGKIADRVMVCNHIMLSGR